MIRRRVPAVLFCALMALSVLASSGFLAHPAIHPHACAHPGLFLCYFKPIPLT